MLAISNSPLRILQYRMAIRNVSVLIIGARGRMLRIGSVDYLTELNS